MTAQNNSEIKGTLQEYSFSDLLAETMQAGLSGSFRLSHLEKKAVVYLQDGVVVFAVSNLREHRLFQILLESQAIGKEVLNEFPNFTNDFELAKSLTEKGIFDQSTVEAVFIRQIGEIIKTALRWETGEWIFSHLARAKETMRFQVNVQNILVDFVRPQSDEKISQKFKSVEEVFVAKGGFRADLSLKSDEGYLFSRFDSTPIKLQDIKTHSGMPAPLTLKILYLLWVGGFIARHNWQSAFSESKVKEILSAKLTLKAPVIKTEAKVPDAQSHGIAKDDVEENENQPDEKEMLEQYLDTVEKAESYYEILNIPIKADVPEIKAAYFKLAKNYHPDRFHHEGDPERQQRIQNAFTEIARAYETLKDEKSRELYDFKLRKYLDAQKQQEQNAGVNHEKSEPVKATMEFEQGFDLLLSEDYENAIPFLARAVQFNPNNARFRAYHGKALSYVKNQRFKAESEINAAIKLDAQNPAYRIMLIEFYIKFNQLKRAEGELQRTLAAFPNNKEVQALLDSLPK